MTKKITYISDKINFFLAGLKTSKDDKKEKCTPSSGGSLSSGSSIVTISSVANSDPDPDPYFPNGADGHPEKKHSSLNEKWQHTTLQVSVPFFIAGIGTIGAGLVLAEVQVSTSYKCKTSFKRLSIVI